MLNGIIQTLISLVKQWIALLLTAVVIYALGRRLYQAGDGWFSLPGDTTFDPKKLVFLFLLVALPLIQLADTAIQQTLVSFLPTGIWLTPFAGVAILGVWWMMNDEGEMNLNDGEPFTHAVLGVGGLLIILPVLTNYVLPTIEFGSLWTTFVVQPLSESWEWLILVGLAGLYLLSTRGGEDE